LPIKTLADLRKQLVWKCEVQFALEINKFWAKRAKNSDKKKECSFTVKCVQMLILNKPINQVASQLSSSVFGNFGVSKKESNKECW